MLTKEVRAALCKPIPDEFVSWKVQSEKGDSQLMVAYIDARCVAERLDEAADGDWSFEWQDLGLHGDRIIVAARLTVCGVVREDVGEHKLDARDMVDPYKSAVSDALKRAAVLFGVGRELYRMEAKWVKKGSQPRQQRTQSQQRPQGQQSPQGQQRTQGQQSQQQGDSGWAQIPSEVSNFWAHVLKKYDSLSTKEILEALLVNDITEFRESKKTAIDMIDAYVEKKVG